MGGEKNIKRELRELKRKMEMGRVGGGREDGGMEVAQGEEEGDLTQIGSLTATAAAAE